MPNMSKALVHHQHHQKTDKQTKSIKVDLLYDPAIALCGICPKKIQLIYQRDICTVMFNAASSIITEIGNLSKCPLMNE
jgi:hypothetical protein